VEVLDETAAPAQLAEATVLEEKTALEQID
jgi:hypothetical protein